MQDRPDSTILLEAIQDFLMKDIMPFVKESDILSYKTLVSWNMLGVIIREIKTGEVKINEEINRLSKVLEVQTDNLSSMTYIEKKELCRDLNLKFSNKVKLEKLGFQDKDAWNLAKKCLEEKIEISNPRFQKGE